LQVLVQLTQVLLYPSLLAKLLLTTLPVVRFLSLREQVPVQLAVPVVL
jgi:hypothetical protein